MTTLKNFVQLNRTEMKNVTGGYMQSPCANGGCTDYGGIIAHQLADGSYAAGNCNEINNPSGCHNYCSNGTTGSFWC